MQVSTLFLNNSFPRANESFRAHKRQRRTRVCANILRREIRPCFASVALRASRAFRLLHNQFFNFPFGKHTQDDRGGYFDMLLHMISTKTKLLSVILSARSTRSFLQSSEASGKKSSRLRRRDLRTITNSLPRQKNCFKCTNAKGERGFVRTKYAAKFIQAKRLKAGERGEKSRLKMITI